MLAQRSLMAQALQVAGLPLAGTRYRGIDDARNMCPTASVQRVSIGPRPFSGGSCTSG